MKNIVAGSIIIAVAAAFLFYLFDSPVLDVGFLWNLKLAFLGAIGLVIASGIFFRYEQTKKFLPYVFAFLISQTGFSYDLKPGYTTSFNEILTVFIFVIWFFRKSLKSSEGIQPVYFKNNLFAYLLLAFTGVLVASFIFQINTDNILDEFKSYVLYLFYLILIPECIDDQKELNRILFFMVLLSLLPITRGMLSAGEIHDTSVERLGVTTWGALNIFVGYIVPLFFLAYAYFVDSKIGVKRIFLLVYLVIVIYLSVLSQTRTGWLAIIVGIIGFNFLSAKKINKNILIFSFVIVAAFSLLKLSGFEATEIIVHRVEDRTLNPDHPLRVRFERAEVAWAIARNYPLTGTGWGGWLPLYGDGTVGDTPTDLLPRWHNGYLEILSQLGFPGLIAFLLLWWKIISNEYKSLKMAQADVEQSSLMYTGLFVSVAACLVYAAGEQQLYRIETASHTYFLAGLLLASGKLARASRQSNKADQRTKKVGFRF